MIGSLWILDKWRSTAVDILTSIRNQMLINNLINWKRILIGNIWRRSIGSIKIRNIRWDSSRKCLFQPKIAEFNVNTAQIRNWRDRPSHQRIHLSKTNIQTILQVKIGLNLTLEVKILRNLMKWPRELIKSHTVGKWRWRRTRFPCLPTPMTRLRIKTRW